MQHTYVSVVCLSGSVCSDLMKYAPQRNPNPTQPNPTQHKPNQAEPDQTNPNQIKPAITHPFLEFGPICNAMNACKQMTQNARCRANIAKGLLVKAKMWCGNVVWPCKCTEFSCMHAKGVSLYFHM